jgi:hypothetical protein
MNEKNFLQLGFKKNKWEQDFEIFTEYLLGNKEVGILISGTTLVEITQGKGVFITVPGCETIEDLKELIRLLNIN